MINLYTYLFYFLFLLTNFGTWDFFWEHSILTNSLYIASTFGIVYFVNCMVSFYRPHFHAHFLNFIIISREKKKEICHSFIRPRHKKLIFTLFQTANCWYCISKLPEYDKRISKKLLLLAGRQSEYENAVIWTTNSRLQSKEMKEL